MVVKAPVNTNNKLKIHVGGIKWFTLQKFAYASRGNVSSCLEHSKVFFLWKWRGKNLHGDESSGDEISAMKVQSWNVQAKNMAFTLFLTLLSFDIFLELASYSHTYFFSVCTQHWSSLKNKYYSFMAAVF